MALLCTNHSMSILRIYVVVLSFLLVLIIQQPFQQSSSTRILDVVEALPSGAAGCSGGGAASLGFHFDYGPGSTSGRVGDTGTLAEFNTTLTIMNTTMRPSNVSVFRGGTELTWMVTAGPDLPIRGVLFRVEPDGDDVDFTLTGEPLLQEAIACFSQSGNVEGITHRTRVTKQNVTGTMRIDKDGLVKIDLTVVYMNGRVAPGDLSLYAYSGFQIDIRNTIPGQPAPVFVAPPPSNAPVDDRCADNTCSAFFGLLPGRLHNRFRGGKCRERCSALNFFVSPLFGWQCGACF